MNKCNECDPKHFVIYGFCTECGKRCQPPIFDEEGQMSFLNYEEFKNVCDKDKKVEIGTSIARNKKI